MKTILKLIWAFIVKNFRWLIPVIVFLIWYVQPDKHFLSFIAGIIFMGFIWYAWTHYLKNKPTTPAV